MDSLAILVKNYTKLGLQYLTKNDFFSTVRFRYYGHSKLRPLVSVPKCIFQCKWVSLMRPVHY